MTAERPALDLAALREKAEKATPGPLHLATTGSWHTNTLLTSGSHWPHDDTDPVATEMSDEDAAYWIAATPQRILTLLDARDAAVRERDAAVREVEELRAVVARKNSALRVAEGALGGLVMDTSDDQRLNDDVLAFVRKGLNATTLGADS